MSWIAKRCRRYVLDYYDNQGERIRKTLKKETTLKKAKEILIYDIGDVIYQTWPGI